MWQLAHPIAEKTVAPRPASDAKPNNASGARRWGRVTNSPATATAQPTISSNVEYKAISAEAGTAHGLSPVLAILDEVGQVKGQQDAFIEAIKTAQGAHDDPLLIAISTQAATDGDLFSIWLDDAKNAKDKRIVSHVYTAEKDCDVMDRKAWKDANPAIGEFRSLTDVEDFAKQAARLPTKEASFRWLYLNQRVEGTSPLLNRSEWMANSEVPDFDASSICYAGLDLSASRDLTAFVRVFKTDGIYHVVPKFFLPATGLRKDRNDTAALRVFPARAQNDLSLLLATAVCTDRNDKPIHASFCRRGCLCVLWASSSNQ